MTQDTIDREFHVFGHYLAGSVPPGEVYKHYHRAIGELPDVRPQSTFDLVLLRIARVHPVLTRAVDVYARLFARKSALHRRLVLLLALLECCPEQPGALPDADSSDLAGFTWNAGWRIMVSVLLLMSVLPILLIARLISLLRPHG